MGQFRGDLKRRNVVRAAIAYLVADWVVLQVAERCEVLVREAADPDHDL